MKEVFVVQKACYQEESQEMELRIAGVLPLEKAGRKLRMIAFFEGKNVSRRFSLDVNSYVAGDAVPFHIRQKISLRDIFYSFQKEQAREGVLLSFAYCTVDGEWCYSEEKLTIPGDFFLKGKKKSSMGFRLFQGVSYVLATLALPLWLLDGYFAQKGYKELHTVHKESRGLKAMLYHADGIVQEISGHGYSLRQWKTNYFVRQYKKACHHVHKTEGVLFLSERKVDEGGNLDLIYRALSQKEENKVTAVLDTRPIQKLPFSVIRRVAKQMAKARVIVLEDFYPQIHAVTLRSDSKLIQLWHACGAFKMFGLSEIGRANHLLQDTKNHRNYSYAITSGKNMVPFYSEAFGLSDHQVLPLGVPRTDIFFQEESREQIKQTLYEKYPMLRGKRVLLFAPTFRGSGNQTAYYPTERFPVNHLMEKLPEDTVLIIKNHPFVKDKWEWEEKYDNRILDLTGKENINNILFITDVLLTDYSSCIFEAALLQITMLFYVFDLEEYMDARDLYFDFAGFAPGVMIHNEEELISAVTDAFDGKTADRETIQHFCEYFLDALDGHSTERVVHMIEELLCD